ncbi:sensor histidine kinase [Pseudidiomarina mangrovi]|uniref:sensor histidine kinase n=1 Tax=Pseudidiomarina mangrovi TaxID=2487133 RepID=UPI000FCC52F5|nr:ATP-binding protein [Pseudidiomarina mangrovi]
MRGFGSISRTITVLLVTTTGVFVGLACMVMVYMQYQQAVQRVSQETADFTQITASLATEHLVFNTRDQLDRELVKLGQPEYVQHVHVYRVDNNGAEINFFASFNAGSLAPIPSRIERLQDLNGVRLSPRYYEAVEAIYLEDRLLGYVYVRVSRDGTDQVLIQAIAAAVLVISSSLLLAYLLALRLRGYITQPLDQAVASVNKIASEKNYSLRLARTNLSELNSLTQAFDIMLGRIQQHIQRQELAEQQASLLNAELERQVNERTEALKVANRELIQTLETLHQYQQELVEAQKMSSLGDMVAGIAHEINTPVGLVITSTSIVQDALAAMAEKFEQKKMTSSDFERFLLSSTENLTLIERNIQRTADLVARFQQLAMDQFAEDSRDFDMVAFGADVVAALHNRFPQLQHYQLEWHCPQPLQVHSRPGPLNQIFIQLVQNSLQHGFEQAQSGHIRIDISVDQANQSLCIDYRDDGVGMPEDLLRKVFEPFTTSKRGSGAAGLGLHFVYNLVRQALKGSIDIDSTPNRGTHVKIEIANAVAKEFDETSKIQD